MSLLCLVLLLKHAAKVAKKIEKVARFVQKISKRGQFY
jgi:hypothetical protein